MFTYIRIKLREHDYVNSTLTLQVEILRRSRSLPVDEEYLSIPRTISWTTGGDQTSHGYYYPPKVTSHNHSTGRCDYCYL